MIHHFKTTGGKIMIKKVEVKCYRERLICDKCGEEMYWQVGEVNQSNPPKYLHYCECGHEVTEKEVYPRVYYEEENIQKYLS